jgi:hypothetical protein
MINLATLIAVSILGGGSIPGGLSDLGIQAFPPTAPPQRQCPPHRPHLCPCPCPRRWKF